MSIALAENVSNVKIQLFCLYCYFVICSIQVKKQNNGHVLVGKVNKTVTNAHRNKTTDYANFNAVDIH